VLVVDDDPVVCRLTARVLADAGFCVLEAHGGEEAAAMLSTASGTVQLLVSDIAMPGMTGVQLRTRVEERWPKLPVLLISGQGGPGDESSPFLAKPFTPDALVAAVGELLPVTPRTGRGDGPGP
jgi:DNA-binding NtrC family response regulator